jgi:hypothetical protein
MKGEEGEKGREREKKREIGETYPQSSSPRKLWKY